MGEVPGYRSFMNCVGILGITCSCVVCVGLAGHRQEVKPLEQYGVEPDYQEPQPTDKQREAAVLAVMTSTSSVPPSTHWATVIRGNGVGVTDGKWFFYSYPDQKKSP